MAGIVYLILSLPIQIILNFFQAIWLLVYFLFTSLYFLLQVVWTLLVVGFIVLIFMMYKNGGPSAVIGGLLADGIHLRFRAKAKIQGVSFGISGGAIVMRLSKPTIFNFPGFQSPFLLQAEYMEMALYVRTMLSKIKVFDIHVYHPHYHEETNAEGKNNVQMFLDAIAHQNTEQLSPFRSKRFKVIIHRVRWEDGKITRFPSGEVLHQHSHTVRDYGMAKDNEWRGGAALRMMLQDVLDIIHKGYGMGGTFDSIPPSEVANDRGPTFASTRRH